MEIEGSFFNIADFQIQQTQIAKNLKDHQDYAAKILNTENGFDGEDQMLFLRETSILRKLSHPSIVKFIGVNFRSLRDPTLLEPTIITEYLSHGSLKDNLLKESLVQSDLEWTST